MCEFFGSSKPFFDEFLEFEVLLSHRHMATRLRSRSQLQQPEIVNERSERPTMSDDFKDRMDEFLRSEKFKEILNVAVSTGSASGRFLSPRGVRCHGRAFQA